MAADPVAGLQAAQHQVLKTAVKAVEVFAKAPGFDLQLLIKEFLLDPEIGQALGLAAPPDFLHRTQMPA